MTPCLFLFLMTIAANPTGAAGAPKLQPNAPRTVIVSDTQTPPVVRAGLLQSTLIELPPEEKIATVFGGDTASWVFDAGHIASRYISIKPKVADSATDLHIISDHGNEYTVELREISSDKDNPHFDSKVSLSSGDPKATANIAKAPVFISAAEAAMKEAQLRKEADDAKKAAAAEHKTSTDANEKFQAAYPGTLHFDYIWDQKKGSALGLQQIWRDDKFTYLRGQFQETPALYELKDGKGSLINFDFANGLYTIPKTVAQGYLSIGKQRVDFKQIKAGS